MPAEQGTTEHVFITPGEPASEGDEDEALMSQELDEGEGDDPELDAGDEQADKDKADQAKDEEFEEVERNGKKARVPVWLKPELMMHADYTRKTQEVAEVRKTLENEAAGFQSRQKEFEQQVATTHENLADYAKLSSINETLQRYQQIDWNALEQQDPLGAQSRWREYGQLKDQAQTIVANLQHKENLARQEQSKRAQKAQHEADTAFAKRQEETAQTLRREYPDWNDDLVAKLSEFAQKEFGYTHNDLVMATQNPRSWKLLRAAYDGTQILARQKAAAAKAKVPEQAQPLTSVQRGRSAPPATGLSDSLSAEEWARRRQAQRRR